ncbi:glycogen/starch synthase [Desulfosarcina ovata]|nr:glycogen/starch synthase [Desulfosarcina ovata]
MTTRHQHPRILVVAPEVTLMPCGPESSPRYICARAGGMGDICSAQVHALYERGVDVHLAVPDYKNVLIEKDLSGVDIHHRQHQLPENLIHLAHDPSFLYHPELFLPTDKDGVRIALAFQREVIDRIIPEIQPDLIHCYDWMTGLIPATARLSNIPCLFTIYRLDSPQVLLSTIEAQGLNTRSFWRDCFYSDMPKSYEETRETNPLELLTSGVFSACQVNTLSQTVLDSLIDDCNPLGAPLLKTELQKKHWNSCLCALSPAPDASFNPATDRTLLRLYGPETHAASKLYNKLHLQETLNLSINSTAPVFFWPTTICWGQPECRMMADTLGIILERYREQVLQIVFVAEGDFHDHLRLLVDQLHAADRVAVCDFDVQLYRMAYGGSDFLLMPVHFAPCALPCIIGQFYGTLPIAHDTGAIHDCVEPLNAPSDCGSGFLFKNTSPDDFLSAIEQAMIFFGRSREFRSSQVERIMRESLLRFSFEDTIRQTIGLYMHMLKNSSNSLNKASDLAGSIPGVA